MNFIRGAQRAVEEFHAATGSTVGEYPHIADEDLRARLILEEACETIAALGLSVAADVFSDYQPAYSVAYAGKPDLVEVADGVADLLYVTLGTAVACGIDIEPIFAAVHASNMAKVVRLPDTEATGVLKREDQKVLKPAGWKPPDILSLLKLQSLGTVDLPGSIYSAQKPDERDKEELRALAEEDADHWAGAWS